MIEVPFHSGTISGPVVPGLGFPTASRGKVALRISFVSGTSSRVKVALSGHAVDYDRQSLVLENLAYADVEPKEEWLVGSGTLGRLIAEASAQPAVEDWERMLDEL